MLVTSYFDSSTMRREEADIVGPVQLPAMSHIDSACQVKCVHRSLLRQLRIWSCASRNRESVQLNRSARRQYWTSSDRGTRTLPRKLNVLSDLMDWHSVSTKNTRSPALPNRGLCVHCIFIVAVRGRCQRSVLGLRWCASGHRLP